MSDMHRIITPEKESEEELYTGLRPQTLKDFVGQSALCDNLSVFIKAAQKRNDVLDHVLFYGPPGLGKTTLAHIVSNELGVGFRPTSGPMITKAGDLAAILTTLEKKDVLFIDEIHRLTPQVEEVLYSAMEDFQLDLVVGEGPGAHSVRIDLNPFTLIGATTRSGLLTNPLRDRFGIPLRLDFYTIEDLRQIVLRGAKLLKMNMDLDGATEIARRSRGTPRIAGRLLRRVRDFAGDSVVTKEMADMALTRLDVDKAGLDLFDRRYLRCIAEKYMGGPVGIDTLAAALSEDRDTLEEVIEPYLMQQGLVGRTPRGRVLSPLGFKALGLRTPKNVEQLDLMLEE